MKPTSEQEITVGSIVQITDASHAWAGKRCVVARMDNEWDPIRGRGLTLELPEQQSLPYGKRMICLIRMHQIKGLSEDVQSQTTNQMPNGFEIAKVTTK